MNKENNRAIVTYFLHPDLGIGGAERLVVDAAVSLLNLKQEVYIATAHYDANRCFDETKNELNNRIKVGGSQIPRHLFGGKFHLFFAFLRTLVAGLKNIPFLGNEESKPDYLIIDQVAFVVPVFSFLFRRSRKTKIIFYCHFPDKLLAPKASNKTSLLRRLYRIVFDYFEEVSINYADEILVNSEFTRSVFQREFPRIKKQPKVLYPCVALESYTTNNKDDDEFNKMDWSEVFTSFQSNQEKKTFLTKCQLPNTIIILSINRFERKKNLAIGIEAVKLIQNENVILVMAGGYDSRLNENVEHLKELQQLVEKHGAGLANRVFFLPSCTNLEKRLLLHLCRVLLYTPENEHFGIVPIEALACERCVVACNSGGPKETVQNERTGLLVTEITPQGFAVALNRFVEDKELARQFGKNGRKFVEEKFTRVNFGKELSEIQTMTVKKPPSSFLMLLTLNLMALLVIVLVFQPNVAIGKEQL